MTAQSNPFPFKQFLFGVIGIIILILLNCTKSIGQSYNFNYRDTEKGNYNLYITTDTIYISESFVYEEAGFRKLWRNEWSEAITETYKSQQYTTIETNSAQYLFLYCENDDTCWQVCEVIYKPKVGDILCYKKLLK
jgi:hypothetical protein